MIPAPPAGTPVRFNPPPDWPVPAGFDPRRGHLADPTWPPPPEGWQFWVRDTAAGRERASLPATALPAPPGQARAERRRVIVVVAVVAAVIGLFWWWGAGRGDSMVGTCWAAQGDGDVLREVSCGPLRADYVVVEVTQTPDDCPIQAGSYLEKGGDVLCLEPYRWEPDLPSLPAEWPPREDPRG